MFLVASYDIPSDQRRARIANALKDYGRRVQYSVFECDLSPEQLSEMVERVKEFLNEEEDSFRIYKLCQGCLKQVSCFGKGGMFEEPDVLIV